jgi:hypothetical protein
MAALNLEVVPGTFAVTKLAPGSSAPDWARRGAFTSVTQTTAELSIVCPEEDVPAGLRSERGWKCVRVAGQLDFSTLGVLASLVNPLAQAGIAVFVISTFDTDYLFVNAENFEQTVQALLAAGHHVC